RLLADRLEVADLVADVLDLQHIELEAELLEVVIRLFREVAREAEPVLVDLLGRELGQHAAQVTGERLLGERLDLGDGLAQQPFDRVVEHGLGRRSDLDVRDRLHGQRDVALGVRLGDRDLERDGAEREPVHALDDPDAQLAAAGDGAVTDLEAIIERAAAAGDDGRHVGWHDDDQRLDREDRDERDGEEDRADDDTEDVEWHCRLRGLSDGRGYSSSRSRYGATYAMPSLTSTMRTEVQVSLSSAALSSGRASSSISRPARCTRILPLPCASG